jgi:hypothetical protein
MPSSPDLSSVLKAGLGCAKHLYTRREFFSPVTITTKEYVMLVDHIDAEHLIDYLEYVDTCTLYLFNDDDLDLDKYLDSINV